MKPILQALVLAERVWTLEDGRKAICGTFSQVVLKRPKREADGAGNALLVGGDAGSPWAYVSLTGVCDGTVLQLQFVSLKRNVTLFKKEISLHGNDRLATVELAFGLPRLTPQEAGGYAFDIVCEGEILGSWRVEVEFIDENDSGDADGAPDEKAKE